MSTAIVQQEQRTKIVPTYSSEQVKLLADTVAKGCTESELKFFLEVARMARLNPFLNQIRPVKRWNSDLGREAMVLQVGIDGYRSMAADTQDLAGIDDAVFDTEDEDHPKWAKVTVYRWSRGEKIPYTATARWSEYVQRKKDGTVNHMWSSKPYLMLAKCSEALALRKAFPAELAGVYTDEEMGQADNPAPEQTQSKPPVQIPSKASDKKPETKQEPPKTEAPAQQTQQSSPQQQSGPVEIYGIIADAKIGKNQKDVWMELDKKLVVIGKDYATDGQRVFLVKGNKIKLHAVQGHSEKLKGGNNPTGEYWDTRKILELYEVDKPKTEDVEAGIAKEIAEAESEEILEGEVIPPESVPADNGLQGLFNDGKVTTAASLPEGSGKKPGSIGSRRAQRLYALMNQNKGKTGLTEDIVHKILANMTPALSSLSDLPVDIHDQFEGVMKGEVDWKPWLEE